MSPESRSPSPQRPSDGERGVAASRRATRQLLRDDFSEPVDRGAVLRSRATDGHLRQGVDAEGVLSVDHEAARIGALANPEFGRAGLAWGPVAMHPGLAGLIVFTNGHNGAQDHPARSRLKFLGRWMLGSGTDPPRERIVPLLRHSSRESLRHRLWRISRLERRAEDRPLVTENTVLGWFGAASPGDVDRPGTVVIAGNPTDSGSLGVRGDGRTAPAIDALGELTTIVMTVAGDHSTVVHAATWPSAFGSTTGPPLRPVAIVRHRQPSTAWLGVQQRLTSETGFSNDSRVRSVRAAQVEPWGDWWTTAVLADELLGDGEDAVGSSPAVGPRWTGTAGHLRRTVDGLAVDRPGSDDGAIETTLDDAIGLVSFTCAPEGPGAVVLRWASGSGEVELTLDEAALGGRADGRDRHVVIRRDPRSWALVVDDEAIESVEVRSGDRDLDPGDRRGHLSLHVSGSWRVRRFEVHPSQTTLPDALAADLPRLRPEGEVMWVEEFAGRHGPLEGAPGPTGTWERTIGVDDVHVVDGGAAVLASPEEPARGRTALTVPWSDPDHVDLSLTLRPPGTARGQQHRGRGGLILWQDPSSYLMVNTWLDDDFAGSSVSVFFHLDGFEDVFDAVWANVGERIGHGVDYRLRVVLDGGELVVGVDDRPVLHRRLTDVEPRTEGLTVRRVGLLANWEWGTDTGTLFRRLEARSPGD